MDTPQAPEESTPAIEALTLQAIPYREYDRVVTLFSAEGLLKIFVRGSKKQRFPQSALTTPLTVADYVLAPGRGELWRLVDASLVSQNLALRKDYDVLHAAQGVLSALLRSQMPGKGAAPLYLLSKKILKALEGGPYPYTLLAAFHLKTLLYEGVLQRAFVCAQCQGPACRRYGGECYCAQHAPLGALQWTEREEGPLNTLLDIRTFTELKAMQTSELWNTQIAELFHQAFRY